MLDRINPVARILSLVVFSTPLLLSVDVVSAAVALAITLLLAPVLGVSWVVLAKRSVPILLAAPISGISMALYGRPEGKEYFSFLFAHVTDNSLELALAIMVRVLAIGLPVIVLLGRIDPTELGDALSQNLKFPSRFVIGAVAGARLVSLFRTDWHYLTLSRRARGLDGNRRIRRLLSMTFSLLVLALRRGSKLATAMEARGFGRYPQRTWARPARWGWSETLLVFGAFLCSGVSLAAAIAVGSFRFLGA